MGRPIFGLLLRCSSSTCRREHAFHRSQIWAPKRAHYLLEAQHTSSILAVSQKIKNPLTRRAPKISETSPMYSTT